MTLSDDDRLWRDQNFPNMSDEHLEKIVQTFGGNSKGTLNEYPNEDQKQWLNRKMPNDPFSKLYQTKEPESKKQAQQNNTNNNHETKQKEGKEEIAYKFSDRGQGQLREAVIIAKESSFIKYNKEEGFIQIEPKIECVTRTLIAPAREECPFIPYEFKTTEESQRYLLKAMKETPDTLLAKIKAIVKKYNAIDDKTITLLSANILGSYFQDRCSTLHYLFVVGANGTGKSALGETFECLGYRAVKVTNTTDSFWFRIFGTVEYGQVTVIAEEFDKMDESSQTMSVLKEGYSPNSKVSRMIHDNSKMEFFYPFGFKIIIGEKSPNEDTARGVLDRSFKIKTVKGYPQHNIKEIRNPQGNPKRQQLFDELDDLRKTLLMYRLIHIKDPYKEIEIGLDGRDEELCKPLLQLFHTLGASEETQGEIERALEHFLSVKNNRKNDSFEASLYPIVLDAVLQNGIDCQLGDKLKKSISAKEIWSSLVNSLEGDTDATKPNIFYSSDHGKIYRNTVTRLICDKFGAEKDHKERGNNLVFDPDNLINTGKIYENNGKIETIEVNQDLVERTDSLTHLEYDTDRGHIMNQSIIDPKKKLKEADSSNTLSLYRTHDESVNQDEIEKADSYRQCPYCEYEEHPFYLKIHVRNAHWNIRIPKICILSTEHFKMFRILDVNEILENINSDLKNTQNSSIKNQNYAMTIVHNSIRNR